MRKESDRLTVCFNATVHSANWSELPALAGFVRDEFQADLKFNILSGNPREGRQFGILQRMNKGLVIIPTYNERDTVPLVIDSILKHDGFDVLVVDDGSPDDTAGVVRKMIAERERVFLVERHEKLGLGTAYITGFKWGLERGYEYFIEMDADGSHDPDALPSFVTATGKGSELIIGSRYLNKAISVVGWDFKRLLLSKFGNYYASWILGVGLTDMTSGFRCYTRKALESVDLDAVHSTGYGFQIEMAYRVSAAGCGVGEMPIIFYERASGRSKMSRKIVREAIVLPWRLRLARTFGRGQRGVASDLNYRIRTIIGFLIVITGPALGLRLGRWLSTEGDIVELIHRAKMSLPAWAWLVIKIGLSAASAVLLISLSLALAIAVFAGSERK